MDKRKLSIKSDQDITVTRNRYGSGYKNKSIFLHEQKKLDPTSRETKQAINEINETYDPDAWLDQFKSKVFEFCSEKNIPTEWVENPGDDITLSLQLRNKYQHIIGARQAGLCLFEIHCCRDSLRQGKHENATTQALRLVQSYSNFLISTLEPTLNKGTHTSKNFKKPAKLTEHELQECFRYFEENKINPDTEIKYTAQKRWELTTKFCSKAFGKEIAPRTLDKKYAKIKNK
ncbi:hypothetical protein [Thalassotalea sp. PS06]|uniref:hypothetical protein n=1 Tax=Thalassotalea sp. PS06 TaxID=2594005 RepID=UPI0011649221|nr:hypothetical protein [Thalassotalea sp. PS06]QDP01811.1 hypothetical protein FNC98_10945 [Thalassotalea sp. PS06]